MKKGLTLKRAIRGALPSMAPMEQEIGKGLVMATLSEAPIEVEHFLWAGCYVRTILLRKGEIGAGAFIKIPTVVIVSGNCKVVVGDHLEEISGYSVLRGMDGRRQVFSAFDDTYITMFFASNAATVEEAEKEFTDEWQLLTNNREELCQEYLLQVQ